MIPKAPQFHSFTVSQNGMGGWVKGRDQGLGTREQKSRRQRTAGSQ